ncbi:MAG: CotH kinase family protein [Bacteroides sp.]|nr:CotH kinase family protein [Prevotella sp.]MCM1408717.1 CotH kinase family protein [Treponema brennaborense]MCM1470632.1 CotH kinase family protein [Bacteroides sp.]
MHRIFSRAQVLFCAIVSAQLVFFSCANSAEDGGEETFVPKRIPILSIETPNGAEITSKEDWLKNAEMSLTGADNISHDFSDISLSIRGRGNSTWAQPKKPYALKLDEKRELLGMPAHKRWVLIANYLDNTFMRNCLAFYLSEQLGLPYTVRGEFVMLKLNGKAQGLYWLGEAIKADENRVNIDEDNDFLIELDSYFDETWKFKSAKKELPYMIKNDDTMTDTRLAFLQANAALLESLLYPEGNSTPNEKYSELLDVDSFAEFYLVNELMSNGELTHPKSCYFTFSLSDTKFKAGPVWDFDWASLSQSEICGLTNTLYYDALFKSPKFKKRLKEIWNSRKRKIDIETQIEHLRQTLCEAQAEDEKIWGAHLDPSEIARADFDAYVDFLKETLAKKRDAVEQMIQGL